MLISESTRSYILHRDRFLRVHWGKASGFTGKKEQQIKHKSHREKVSERGRNVGTASKGAQCNHQHNPCKITRHGSVCIYMWMCVCDCACILLQMTKQPTVSAYFTCSPVFCGATVKSVLSWSGNNAFLEKNSSSRRESQHVKPLTMMWSRLAESEVILS